MRTTIWLTVMLGFIAASALAFVERVATADVRWIALANEKLLEELLLASSQIG